MEEPFECEREEPSSWYTAVESAASELLLFVQAHEYQFECKMKHECAFSGHCSNPSRIQDWYGGEKR